MAEETDLKLDAGSRVGFLAFSPDGKTLAVACGKAVHLVDADTGRERWRLNAGGTVAFSVDGKTLASAGEDGCVWLRDAATGKALQKFRAHEGAAVAVAFSPDGARVATAGADCLVALWEAATGKKLFKINAAGDALYAAAFSPDGRWIASAGMNGVRLWDSDSGKELRQVSEPIACQSVLFSPDGRSLAAVVPRLQRPGNQGPSPSAVIVWDAVKGGERFRIEAAGIGAAAFSPDGKTLAWTEGECRVHLVRADDGKELTFLIILSEGVGALAFSPDGSTLACGGDKGTVYFRKTTAVPTPSMSLDALWDQLAGEHGSAAIQALAAQPEKAVALLKSKLQPAAGDEERIQKLILQLDDDSYGVREKASQGLRDLGTLAEPSLRKAMEESKSAEVKERARVLVEALETEAPLEPGEALRAVRAIQLLGLIGTPEAKALLEELAKGAPGARQTREAKSVLERLNHPPPIPRRK